MALGLDCAASEFYKDGKYKLDGEGLSLSAGDFTNLLATWCDKYPIISIEDAMAENDWDGWSYLTEALGKKIQLVGDDLFVTNTKILREGIQKGIANSVLIKINQIGTLTETFAAIEMAKRAGYTSVISHRSGETEDSTIADIAVGTNVDANQDWLDVAFGPHGQVQPIAAHRRRPGRHRQLSGPRRVLQLEIAGKAIVRPMRLIALCLATLLLLIQYPLWLGKGGWLRTWDLERQVAAAQKKNEELKARNAKLASEVSDLKDGTGAVEERARLELGMIKNDEIFVQIAQSSAQAERQSARWSSKPRYPQSRRISRQSTARERVWRAPLPQCLDWLTACRISTGSSVANICAQSTLSNA